MKILRIMLVRFKSFGPIRRLLDKQLIEVEVPEGTTVLEVVQKITDLGGSALKDLILKNGKIDGNLIVMLNKKDVSTIGGVDLTVSNGDEIALLPHVQGG
ncbi:molybdopterin synthase sulfur carrier subunit [Candidatus Thorarchaeota archaeon]|nr:MAG: molybdopterin synthase sulfur carrier subunit [Candidatus Thorarchaeota archaeon]